MSKTTDIIIENNLVEEKRGLNVYHRQDRSIHLIGCGNAYTVSLIPLDGNDYIHLSVAVGSGIMEQHNVIDLPSWLNYEFLSEGRFAVRHDSGRTCLNIPAGLPEWKLKLSLPQCRLHQEQGRVTVSEKFRQ